MKTILQLSLGIFLLVMAVILFRFAWIDYQNNTVPVTASVVECYQSSSYYCDYKTDNGYETKELSRQDWRDMARLTGHVIEVIIPSERGSLITNIIFGLVALVGFIACVVFAVIPDEYKHGRYYC